MIVEEVEREFLWCSGWVIDVFENFLKEGLVMIDDGDFDGKCYYWFFCVGFFELEIEFGGNM